MCAVGDKSVSRVWLWLWSPSSRASCRLFSLVSRHHDLYIKMMSNNSRSNMNKKPRFESSTPMDGSAFLGQKPDGTVANLQDSRSTTPPKARDNSSAKRRRQFPPKTYGAGAARGFEVCTSSVQNQERGGENATTHT